MLVQIYAYVLPLPFHGRQSYIKGSRVATVSKIISIPQPHKAARFYIRRFSIKTMTVGIRLTTT
jgi:hypothetical protein